MTCQQMHASQPLTYKYDYVGVQYFEPLHDIILFNLYCNLRLIRSGIGLFEDFCFYFVCQVRVVL